MTWLLLGLLAAVLVFAAVECAYLRIWPHEYAGLVWRAFKVGLCAAAGDRRHG